MVGEVRLSHIVQFKRRVYLVIIAGLMILLVAAGPALAVPDWKRDGRPGYPTHAHATTLARQFTQPGAPRDGLRFRIVKDPDGGFTPVFYDPRPTQGAGA